MDLGLHSLYNMEFYGPTPWNFDPGAVHILGGYISYMSHRKWTQGLYSMGGPYYMCYRIWTPLYEVDHGPCSTQPVQAPRAGRTSHCNVI